MGKEQTAQALYYSQTALIETIVVILREFSLEELYALMRVRAWQWRRKTSIRLESYAMLIALWRMALAKSFPKQWEMIFIGFLERLECTGLCTMKEVPLLQEAIAEYIGLFDKHGENDFLPAVDCFCQRLAGKKCGLDETFSIRQRKSLLFFRAAYESIFKHMVVESYL